MFCRIFCKQNKNPKKAAIKAGYPSTNAEKIANKLLANEEILQLIKSIKMEIKKEKIFQVAYSALKKIISSNTNDAVVLAAKFEDFDYEQIKKLNLFQITQIKKLKDCSFEFNFIDKLKAVETLLLLLEKLEKKDSGAKLTSFLNALTNTSNNLDYRLEQND